MNRLNPDERIKVIAALVEGNSIRAVSRMTGIARNTIADMLVDLGTACAEFQDNALRNLTCKRIQCDEIWAFCYAKDKNVPQSMQGQFGIGSVWTWTAIDADTKLIVSWMVGNRDAAAATEFMMDLSGRLSHRIQLTTDGHQPYLQAVDEAFSGDIDYAMLVKIYGASGEMERRYSPASFVAAEKRTISGNPERRSISTSYVERQNLTMRMCMRRFTRLTNGFSKKVENHIAAVFPALHVLQLVRVHQTLRVTPAMAAGASDKLWEIGDIVRLLGGWEARQEAEKQAEREARAFGVAPSSLPRSGRRFAS